jgi:hypothetical protein
MAKTPIGEPIPVGDPSFSADNNPKIDSAKIDNPAAAIDALRTDILQADAPLSPASETEAAFSAAEYPLLTGWLDATRVGWQVALMPAMTWTSYLAASWKAWETSVQPQWPTR